jgi:uncharacterized membrane protein YhaH (DUF805 family)
MSTLSILFSLKGRIARKTYWLRGVLVLYLTMLALSAALFDLDFFLLPRVDTGPDLPPPFSVNIDAETSRAWIGTGFAEIEVDAVPDTSAATFEETVDFGFAVGRLNLAGGDGDKGRSFLGSFQWEKLPLSVDATPAGSGGIMAVIASLVMTILSVAIFFGWFWCSIAIGAKRCHDRGRSGWFQLISLIPVVGVLWLFVDLGLLRGTEGENRFGPNPLGSDEESAETVS